MGSAVVNRKSVSGTSVKSAAIAAPAPTALIRASRARPPVGCPTAGVASAGPRPASRRGRAAGYGPTSRGRPYRALHQSAP